MSIESRHTYGSRPGMCWDGRVSIPTCDGCGKELPACGDFNEARVAMKEAGWKTEKESGHWVNYCPDCQEE